MSVAVVSKTGMLLMPTSEYRARKLLKSKKAIIHGYHPFTIQLTERETGYIQPVELCMDTGYTTIDTDNPSMDDLLTFFHKNHVRILRFLVRSNAAKDFCNALSISDCSNEELLRLLSATNDKSTVIRAYILDALSEKEEKSEKLKL